MPSPVKWNSAQADGQGKLTASLLFSSDGGQTWRMIAVDITGTTFIVDPAHLPGTQQGQLRLQITDGLNTTTIDGPRDLQIPARPPGVFITEPIDGSYVGPGSHLLLRADAISPQEGTLGDKAL